MITAIIIDDEANSRSSLRQKLTKHCPDVTIIAECENGDDGIDSIRLRKPDLLFLDVEMPRMNGFAMLQQLGADDIDVIFVTAYDHYAIQAIRFSAMDYLVKPVEVEELITAVAKVARRRKQDPVNLQLTTLLQNLQQPQRSQQKLAIPSMEGIQFVEIADIIYVEAQSNYAVFYLTGGRKYIVSKTLKEFEELLPELMFFRIHHSCLINTGFVEKYIRGDGGQVVMKGGAVLDVARRKKDEFLKVMGYV